MKYLHCGRGRLPEVYELPGGQFDVVADRRGPQKRWDVYDEMPAWWALLKKASREGDPDRSFMECAKPEPASAKASRLWQTQPKPQAKAKPKAK